MKIETLDKKYAVVLSEDGRLQALRYGHPWRDCIGDGLILSLAQDIETLTERNAKLRSEKESLAAALAELIAATPATSAAWQKAAAALHSIQS